MTAEKIRTEKQREAARVYEQEVLGGGALQRTDGVLQAAAATDPNDPGQLLAMAIKQGADPAALEKLVGLYERLDARRAEKDFSAAMLAFQNECHVVAKNKTANAGQYSYDYASLDYLATTIRPYLNRHGLSYTFDGAVTDGMVRVVTIVRHVGGHEQRTTFQAPVDLKSRMNVMQQVASATSYARRYGLLLALGLATGEDDDGVAAGGEFIDEDQVQTIVDLIAETKTDPEQFLRWAKVDQIAHIPAREYKRAMAVFAEKKRKAGA